MVRQRKTRADRAQEALDVAQRLVERLSTKLDQLEVELDQVRSDLKQAVNRRDYALSDPDLPAQDSPEFGEPGAPTAEQADLEASQGMDEPTNPFPPPPTQPPVDPR
jgi:hypothetical protein